MKRLRCDLKAIIEERGMSQKQLAELTKIREATISALCNDEMKRFPRDVLEKIAVALNIDDIREIITFENIEE